MSAALLREAAVEARATAELGDGRVHRAVADWLDTEAEGAEQQAYDASPQAFAVARAYLGVQS